MHSVLGHSQDGFDESLCLGMPADAPAIAPAPAPTVSLGPRCNDNLTALFNSGPVPASAPAEAPSVPPDMLPGVAPAVIPVEPPLPAPAVPPAPIEVVGPEEEEQQPEEAEAPPQQTRDGGDESPVSDPEAASAMHLPGGVLPFACAVLAGLIWG